MIGKIPPIFPRLPPERQEAVADKKGNIPTADAMIFC